MSKRGAGIALIALAGVLFSVRYISAAIFGSGTSNWSADLYRAMLEYIGPAPTVLSALSLAAGVAYLVWAEYDAWSTARRR